MIWAVLMSVPAAIVYAVAGTLYLLLWLLLPPRAWQWAWRRAGIMCRFALHDFGPGGWEKRCRRCGRDHLAVLAQ